MVYIFLNAALAAYLIWASMNVNTKKQGMQSVMINVLLLSAASTIVMFLTVICIYYGPERLVIILEHLQFFFIAAIYIELSTMFVSILRKERSTFVNAIRVILLIFAAYVSFFRIHIDDPSIFSFSAKLIFKGFLAYRFPITWVHFYIAFFVFICPSFSFLIMLLTAENSESRLFIQRTLMCFVAVVFGWVGLTILYFISDMLPMMRALYMYIIAVMSIMVLNIVSQEKLYDFSMVSSAAFSIIVKYFVPAVAGAVIYVLLRPLYSENETLYMLLVFAGVFLVMVVSKLLNSGMTRILKYRSNQYEEEFEAALASIDYENEASDISAEFLKAFSDNLQTAEITTLIDNGVGDFVSSASEGTDNKNYSIPKNQKFLEILMNNDVAILFEEEIESNYLLVDCQDEVSKVFEETESKALIILHEGHSILGLLLLGAKRTGGSYDEYDKTILDKFYSYFFVYGYYMKNIANASVVGTVNREIRMSSQIITSIQENMDYIHNPKIDVGYLMVPAHNIGGEFVDLIRLNDTSHIMVVGALSGKGISASMSMVILKSVIRTFLADTHDFKKLIQKVNAFIRFNLPSGTYFSGLFCLLDFATDSMYYVNCGIPTFLEYSKAYNNVIEIQGKGYVLGFVKDITPLIKVKQVKLMPGDMFAISTSGLINSHSLRGDQFGKDRIKQALMDNYTYPSNRIAKFTFDNLQKFMSKELEGDITLVVFKYHGKDSVHYVELDSSLQDGVADFSDDIDVDALLENAIDESVQDSDKTENSINDVLSENNDINIEENVQNDFEIQAELENSSINESVSEESRGENFTNEISTEEVQNNEIQSNENLDLDSIAQNVEKDLDSILSKDDDLADFNIDDIQIEDFDISKFDDDMFNADFSNPNKE